MATSIPISQDEMSSMLKAARLSKQELAERLGHWSHAASRWKDSVPTYVVEYLRIRGCIFGIVEHIEYGTVPKSFDFIGALKEMKLKKAELARILGVSKHSVTRWGNEPPQYALEYVYCRWLMERCINGYERAE